MLCSINATYLIGELEEYEKEVPGASSSAIQFFFWTGQLDSDDHNPLVNS